MTDVITVPRHDLIRALTAVRPGRATRAADEALKKGVLLRARDDQVAVTTSTGSSWMSTIIDGAGTGDVLVDHSQLKRLLASGFAGDAAVIDIWQNGDTAWVSAAESGHVGLPAWPPDSVFPPPKLPPVVAEVDPGVFGDAARRVTTIDTDPVLAWPTALDQTHLTVDAETRVLTVAASDGYIAAIVNVPVSAVCRETVTTLIPTRLLAKAWRPLIRQRPRSITLHTSPGLVALSTARATVISRVAAADPLPIERVIPTRWSVAATVDRVLVTELAETLAAAAPKPADGWSRTRLVVEPGRMSLALVREDGPGPDRTIPADVDYPTASRTWWLNPRQLLTVLRLLTGDTVTIAGTNPRKPLLLTGGDSMLAAIQPMKPPDGEE